MTENKFGKLQKLQPLPAESIWFEALTGFPQAAVTVWFGGGGAPQPVLPAAEFADGGGPQPMDPSVSSPPPKSPMMALRLPQPVPRRRKERSSSLEAVPVLLRQSQPSVGMWKEIGEAEPPGDDPVGEQLFALRS